MLTRSELETALDGHRLYMRMHTGNWWVLRRAGKTQTWKTRDGAFRIPFKAGFRATGALTEADLGESNFRIGWTFGGGQVLVPHDMVVNDEGIDRVITYKGCEINVVDDGKIVAGIYIGPFVVTLPHNELVNVGTLDAARKRIDEEEAR